MSHPVKHNQDNPEPPKQYTKKKTKTTTNIVLTGITTSGSNNPRELVRMISWNTLLFHPNHSSEQHYLRANTKKPYRNRYEYSHKGSASRTGRTSTVHHTRSTDSK